MKRKHNCIVDKMRNTNTKLEGAKYHMLLASRLKGQVRNQSTKKWVADTTEKGTGERKNMRNNLRNMRSREKEPLKDKQAQHHYDHY